MAVVTIREVDGVGVVTLDDPLHRNAITLAMADELIAAVDDVAGEHPRCGRWS